MRGKDPISLAGILRDPVGHLDADLPAALAAGLAIEGLSDAGARPSRPLEAQGCHLGAGHLQDAHTVRLAEAEDLAVRGREDSPLPHPVHSG
jgi:hypothetical protein